MPATDSGKPATDSENLGKVAYLGPESPAGIDRNRWPASIAITGRHAPEYALQSGRVLIVLIVLIRGLGLARLAALAGGQAGFCHFECTQLSHPCENPLGLEPVFPLIPERRFVSVRREGWGDTSEGLER